MSAMIEQMRPDPDPDAGGTLAPDSAPFDGAAQRVHATQPMSPELALIDPDLARAARALLPDPVPAPRQRTSSAPIVVAEKVERTPAPRRPRLSYAVSIGVTAAAAALALILVVDRQDDEAPRLLEPRVASRAPAAPPAAAATVPRAPEAVGQTFVWAPAQGADAYEFQLFRAAARIFRTRVTEPRLDLPSEWNHGGLRHVLEPGTYRWYVWPISAQTGQRSRVATVQARLVIRD